MPAVPGTKSRALHMPLIILPPAPQLRAPLFLVVPIPITWLKDFLSKISRSEILIPMSSKGRRYFFSLFSLVSKILDCTHRLLRYWKQANKQASFTSLQCCMRGATAFHSLLLALYGSSLEPRKSSQTLQQFDKTHETFWVANEEITVLHSEQTSQIASWMFFSWSFCFNSAFQ